MTAEKEIARQAERGLEAERLVTEAELRLAEAEELAAKAPWTKAGPFEHRPEPTEWGASGVGRTRGDRNQAVPLVHFSQHLAYELIRSMSRKDLRKLEQIVLWHTKPSTVADLLRMSTSFIGGKIERVHAKMVEASLRGEPFPSVLPIEVPDSLELTLPDAWPELSAAAPSLQDRAELAEDKRVSGEAIDLACKVLVELVLDLSSAKIGKVADIVRVGRTPRAVADILGLTPEWVSHHIERVYGPMESLHQATSRSPRRPLRELRELIGRRVR